MLHRLPVELEAGASELRRSMIAYEVLSEEREKLVQQKLNHGR